MTYCVTSEMSNHAHLVTIYRIIIFVILFVQKIRNTNHMSESPT